MSKPVFRFAPSPNGLLHLGHAYSALLNQKMAREAQGKLLLRIEDIDIQRCTPELETQMLHDLEWIGFEWDEKPRRQSQHFDDYAEALKRLKDQDFVYPSTLSRSEIKKIISAKKDQDIDWPCDPDGTPLYPGAERELSRSQCEEIFESGNNYALRLNTQKLNNHIGKKLSWTEITDDQITKVTAKPLAWGDVIIARKDFPMSYHLCCTVDDAIQGITHVVRGKDLYDATSIHCMLNAFFGHEQPVYHHHELILDVTGQKLSKSKQHKSLKELRSEGLKGEQIREQLGFI